MRLLMIVLAIGGIIAWALALAFQLPFAPWFSYALWAGVAAGFIVRAVRSRRRAAKVAFEAANEVQNIYLGRKTPTMYPTDPRESAQYGDPPAPGPLTHR